MTAEGIATLLDSAVAAHGARPALTHGDAVVTYAELDALTRDLARRIADRTGDVRGARVAIVAPNSPALVSAWFAALRLGAVPVPLNARLRERELGQILADAEPVVVVSVGMHLGYSHRDLLGRLAPTLLALRAWLVVTPAGEVEEEIDGPADASAQPLGPEVGAILYTSGTTGVPKGVLVTHGRETAAAPFLAGVLQLSPADTSVFVVPISHAFGLTCYLATVASGGNALLVESTATAAPLLQALERHAPRVLHGSPAVFTALLKALPESPGSVRIGFVAGASSPPRLLERLDDAGARILNLYGLSETGGVSCCHADDPPEIRTATAGRALPGFGLRIVDGELQIRGAAVTPGYHRRPDETAAALVDGWLRTGDVATIDDGILTIAGRAKDVVHVGGFNVFPAEVEGALLEHPEVLHAVVLGGTDERMGEVLQAFVVARPGATVSPVDLLRFLRGLIAGYKLPYHIRLVDELPLLASGKPDRRAVAKLL